MENQEKKVILVSDYGRSGQGWLSYMLCYILNAKYIESYAFLRGVLYSPDERLRSLTSGNLPGRQETKYSMVIKTHEWPDSKFDLTDKVIFLTRDPRDVAVSSYFRYQVTNKEEKHKSFKNHIFYLIQKTKLTSFILTAFKWKKHFLRWSERKDIPFYQVRYEDVLIEGEKTLKDILEYLEISVEPHLIKEAVEKFSFEKFSGGRKSGQENIKSASFRKGIIGDYKNHFSKLDLLISKLICGKEAEKAGYNF